MKVETFLFSIASWAQIRATQQILISYWMNRRLEPSGIMIQLCTDLFYSIPSTCLSCFPLTVLCHRVASLSGSPSSLCTDIHPAQWMHLLPSGTCQNMQNTSLHCYFLFWNFQVSRTVEGTVQLTPLYFSCVHQLLNFSIFAVLSFSGIIWVCWKCKITSPLTLCIYLLRIDILPH